MNSYLEKGVSLKGSLKAFYCLVRPLKALKGPLGKARNRAMLGPPPWSFPGFRKLEARGLVL